MDILYSGNDEQYIVCFELCTSILYLFYRLVPTHDFFGRLLILFVVGVGPGRGGVNVFLALCWNLNSQE